MADFEERLRAAVTERAGEFTPADDLPARIGARVAHRRRQQRLLAGGLAAGVTAAALLVGVLVSRPTTDNHRVETADQRATSTTTTGSTSTTSSTTSTTDGTTTSSTAGTTGTTTGSPGPTAAPPPTGTGPSTSTTTTTEPDRRPPDGDSPAAGTCGQTAGAVAEVTLNPDVPSPRCVQVRPDQSLRVRNATDQPVDVSFGGTSATVAAGAAQAFPRPFGEYLAPGVHRVSTSLYGGSGPEIYLVP